MKEKELKDIAKLGIRDDDPDETKREIEQNVENFYRAWGKQWRENRAMRG